MKIKAYKVSPEALKSDRMMNYNEMCDGSTKIVPMKLRNLTNYFYHVAEDVRGNIYLLEDSTVVLYKLKEKNLPISKTKYLLDHYGREQIKLSDEDKGEENE